MNREQLIRQAQHELDSGALAATLARRIAWRSESDLGAEATEASRALRGYRDEMQPWLQALGFDCQILPNPVAGAGPPAGAAHRRPGPAHRAHLWPRRRGQASASGARAWTLAAAHRGRSLVRPRPTTRASTP
jgi:hypothetical protein